MNFFKKSDLFIIGALILISTIGSISYRSLTSQEAVKAEIYYGSQLIETIDLEQAVDRTFSVPQKENVIFHQYADGSIRFEHSDCPDKVCIHAGKLNTVGDFAACLPNELILKIVRTSGPDENEADLVVGN